MNMNESSVGKFNPELAKSVDSYCFLYLLGVYLFEVLKLKEGDGAFPSDPSAMGITGGSSYYTPGGELIARSYAVSDKHGLYLDFRVGSAVTDYYGRDILGSSFSGEPGWRGLKYSRELSLAVVCRLFKLLVDFWDNDTDTTVLNLVPFHHPLPGVEEEETPQPPVRRSTRRKKAAAPAPDFSRIEEFKSLYCVKELEKRFPTSEIFYQQALFFADFAPSDDNATGGSLFTNGVATTLYSRIPDHLPRYFLWRTSFRNGVGSFAPPVFFGLLLSEIFNGIGCGGGIREIIKQARDVQETLYTVPLFFTQGQIPASVQRISDWIWDLALITQPDPELLPKWLKFGPGAQQNIMYSLDCCNLSDDDAVTFALDFPCPGFFKKSRALKIMGYICRHIFARCWRKICMAHLVRKRDSVFPPCGKAVPEGWEQPQSVAFSMIGSRELSPRMLFAGLPFAFRPPRDAQFTLNVGHLMHLTLNDGVVSQYHYKAVEGYQEILLRFLREADCQLLEAMGKKLSRQTVRDETFAGLLKPVVPGILREFCAEKTEVAAAIAASAGGKKTAKS